MFAIKGRSIRKRKVIPLEMKIKILDRLKVKGRKMVCREFGLCEGTVRNMEKNEEMIRKKANSQIKCKTRTYRRDSLVEDTEKYLVKWLEDLCEAKTTVNRKILKDKALEIYNELLQDEAGTSKIRRFNASPSWLAGFLKKYVYGNTKLNQDFFKKMFGKNFDKNSQEFQQLREVGDEETETGDFNMDENEENDQDRDEQDEFEDDQDLDGYYYDDVEDYDEDEEDGRSTLTLDKIREGLLLAKDLIEYFLYCDDDVDRALKFQLNVEACIAVYQNLYQEVKKSQKRARIIAAINAERMGVIEISSDEDTNSEDMQPLASAFFGSSLQK